MGSYHKDIVAERTPEISDSEEDQPGEENGSLILKSNREFLITLEDLELSIDQTVSEKMPALPIGRKRPVPVSFIDKQKMFSDHRNVRYGVVRRYRDKQAQQKVNNRMKAPKPKLVSKASVFQQRPFTCQDKELIKLKEKVAAESADKAKKEDTMFIAQLKNNKAKALIEKLERDVYTDSKPGIDNHFEIQKMCRHSPSKHVAVTSTDALSMTEEVIVVEPVESQMDYATHLVHKLVLDDKIREANMKRADEFTTDLADLQIDKQPMDVFQRMWTLVSLDNPIWNYYRRLLRDLKEKRSKCHRELAACSRCMTIFFPFFPDDHHLHKSSKTFKTAVDDRRVNTCLNTMVEAPKERVIYESSTYQALVSLAKEAKAYKKDSTGEYIKLVRFANGTRNHRGKGNYEQLEMCENCDVEFDLKEEARKRFKVQNLGAGILNLIFMYALLTTDCAIRLA
jgi:hypothetical protein